MFTWRRGIVFFLSICVASLILTLVFMTYPSQIMKSSSRARTKTFNGIPRRSVMGSLATPDEDILFNTRYPPRDRIRAQMKHVPEVYRKAIQSGTLPTPKLILRYDGIVTWSLKPGNVIFRNCPVSRCEMSMEPHRISEMDAVLFEHGQPHRSNDLIPLRQIWILHRAESPRVQMGLHPGDQFNWTLTYRSDSTIPNPYSLANDYTSFNLSNESKRNYADKKSKKVVWFVSNCHEVNNRRQYADQLSKHIQVDIFGRCGKTKCEKMANNSKDCLQETLKDYKFYLAFENSNCRHYVTEKLFTIALGSGILPIVMGAPIEDYNRIAPPHSFIHVEDFKSPAHLAEYLHEVDKNDTLYNSYFKWRGSWTFPTEVTPWCRLCSLLHEQDSRSPSWYENPYKWWRGDGICRPKWKGYSLLENIDLNGWRVFNNY